MLYYALLSPTL